MSEPGGEVLPASALIALHRAMLWREARASVALDRDEHVRTISLDDWTVNLSNDGRYTIRGEMIALDQVEVDGRYDATLLMEEES